MRQTKQARFIDTEDTMRKRTMRREAFLNAMDESIPWDKWGLESARSSQTASVAGVAAWGRQNVEDAVYESSAKAV